MKFLSLNPPRKLLLLPSAFRCIQKDMLKRRDKRVESGKKQPGSGNVAGCHSQGQ